MALASAEARGMPSNNDFERGLIGAFLVKAFLPTSGLVWKIKIPKPLRGIIALYLDSSLASLRFVRGWILLMTRVVVVSSDRFFPPLIISMVPKKNSKRKIHRHYILPTSAKRHWDSQAIPHGRLVNWRTNSFDKSKWHCLTVLVWQIFLPDFYPYELLRESQMASSLVAFLWAQTKSFSLNNQFFTFPFPLWNVRDRKRFVGLPGKTEKFQFLVRAVLVRVRDG